MQQPRLWHSFDKDSVCRTLDTSPAGLLPAEAQSRLSHYGLNRLPQARKRRWYVRLAGHIHNALIYIMLVASVITFLMGHVVDEPPPIKESISRVNPDKLWTTLRRFINGTEALHDGADYRAASPG